MRRHLVRLPVDPRALDAAGELPLPALAAGLEQAAGEHAAALGCGIDVLLARGLGWVMLRQRIETLAPLRAGDDLEIATWPSGVERLVVSREFEVRRAGEVVARASTAWLVLDLAARRPVRPATVLDPSLRERLPALAPTAERLPEPGSGAAARRLEVRPEDIDANAHVNNGAYLRWALEAAPAEVRRAGRAAAVEAHYLAEALLGDVVLLRWAGSGDGLLHEVQREADGKVLARLATAWAIRP